MACTRFRNLAFALFVAAPLYAGTEPYFAISRAAAPQGGTITVAGAGFPITSAGVSISAGDSSGVRTTLAVALLNNGSFTKSFALPSTLTPGMYFVNVVDSTMRGGMNLTGPLTIVPATGPWFVFSPPSAAPGQTMTVTAQGFSSSSTGAGVALISGSGQATLLGTAAVSGGAFTKSFTVPQLGPNAGFGVLVKDALGQTAFNSTGAFTIGPAPPSLTAGFYPVAAAVNSATNRVYIAVGGSDSLSVIDGATNKVTASVASGSLPCAIGVNPTTNRVYVANINSNNLSVFDGGTNSVVATLPMGKAPCALAVNPQNNRIYVGNYSDNTLSVLDGNTNAIIATVPTPQLPAGLGINTVTNRIYVTGGFQRSVAVIDGSTNAMIASVPVGPVPDAIGVNETTNRIYAANFFGRSVTVIDGNTNSVITNIPVGIAPSAVGVDPGTNKIYVANYMGSSVSVIDGATNAVTGTIPAGRISQGLAVNPATRTVYVANSADNTVSVIRE